MYKVEITMEIKIEDEKNENVLHMHKKKFLLPIEKVQSFFLQKVKNFINTQIELKRVGQKVKDKWNPLLEVVEKIEEERDKK